MVIFSCYLMFSVTSDVFHRTSHIFPHTNMDEAWQNPVSSQQYQQSCPHEPCFCCASVFLVDPRDLVWTGQMVSVQPDSMYDVSDTHRVSFLSQSTFGSCNSSTSVFPLETWWSWLSPGPILTLLSHPLHDPRVTNKSWGPWEARDTKGALNTEEQTERETDGQRDSNEVCQKTHLSYNLTIQSESFLPEPLESYSQIYSGLFLIWH